MSTKKTKIKPLDVLADEANFADVEDSASNISASGKKVNTYVKGQKRMFYMWGAKSTAHNEWHAIDIITFDDPKNYSDVKMYHLSAQMFGMIFHTQTEFDLTKETPTRTGNAVVKLLERYAKRYAKIPD